MESHKITIISNHTQESLRNLCSQISSENSDTISNISDEILSNVIQKSNSSGKESIHKKIESIIVQKSRGLPQAERKLIRRAVVAKMALGLPAVIEKLNLPKSILDLYPGAFDRLVRHLSTNINDAYDITDDFFRKDIDFVMGLSVPCGTPVVDLRSKILIRSVLRSLFRPGNLMAILRYIGVGVTGTWFCIHTESRNLSDFNEQGWDECYYRIAELLERRKTVRGVFGTSWFYDPQLLTISPHLVYLRRRPLERGAFFIRHGSSQVDIERATVKSKTRRDLYKEGKYKPVTYSLIWPREAIISWAQSQRRD